MRILCNNWEVKILGGFHEAKMALCLVPTCTQKDGKRVRVPETE